MALRVQPSARRDALEGVAELADGALVLKVKVSAVPEAGRANSALIKLLAKTWGLPKSDLELLAGHGQRRKTLLVAGDPAALEATLGAWLTATGGRTGR